MGRASPLGRTLRAVLLRSERDKGRTSRILRRTQASVMGLFLGFGSSRAPSRNRETTTTPTTSSVRPRARTRPMAVIHQDCEMLGLEDADLLEAHTALVEPLDNDFALVRPPVRGPFSIRTESVRQRPRPQSSADPQEPGQGPSSRCARRWRVPSLSGMSQSERQSRPSPQGAKTTTRLPPAPATKRMARIYSYGSPLDLREEPRPRLAFLPPRSLSFCARASGGRSTVAYALGARRRLTWQARRRWLRWRHSTDVSREERDPNQRT
jgi:hypothetical protein